MVMEKNTIFFFKETSKLGNYYYHFYHWLQNISVTVTCLNKMDASHSASLHKSLCFNSR